MQKWIFYLCCLLVGVGGFAGCSEEKYDGPLYFDEMADEEVIYELEDEPGYVLNIYDGYAFISCSKYVDEFLAYPDDGGFNMPMIDPSPVSDRVTYPKDTTIVYDPDYAYFLSCEVLKEQIGVFIDDFRKYDIQVGSKVYVTASITNNRKDLINNPESINKISKAYLHDLRVRE